MKMVKRILLLCLLFLVTGSLTGTRRAMAQPGVSVSFQAFYDELAPYGQWINYGGYGRVWIPRVESDFQPYGSRGQWVVTDYGNTWVSDYDWGWAPFHYGRWLLDNRYGWIWVPGSDWGPAWVSWRSGGGYYGWAPLGPGVDININIDIPLVRWIFVPQRYITSPSVYAYCIPGRRSVNIYRSTTIINNIYVNNDRRYFYGPQRREIERVTRNRVTVHHIDNMDRPGRAMASNGSLRIYRPEFREGGRPSGNSYSDRNYRNPGDNREPGRYDNRPDRTPPTHDNNIPDYNRETGRDRYARDQNSREREREAPERWTAPQPSPEAGDQRNSERPREPRNRWNRGEDQSPQYQERNNGNSQREESRQPQDTPRERPQRPERSRPSRESGNTDRGNSSSERSERPSRSSGRTVRM